MGSASEFLTAAGIACSHAHMDATTLYVIIMLANGDVRTADLYPLGSVQRCREAARAVVFRDRITNDHLRAGAKSVMFYCAPWPKLLRIAR